jgi:hypothetical protein
MKYTVLAAVAALVAGTAATAHAENARSGYGATQSANSDTSSEVGASKAYPEKGSNAASLKALLAEWDQAGFNPPSKPAQYRVYGRNGYVTSGPGYNTIVSQIHSAVIDARQGRDRAEATDIARARSVLAGTATSTPAGTSTPSRS